jgi:cellulose synthase (UDP-forming)
VSDIVQQGISAAQESASRRDILALAATLEEMAEAGDARAAEARQHILANISDLAKELKTDARSLGLKEDVLDSLDLTRTDEAQPILPLATISITEDMATAMRLHALGWQSIFHTEILAYGLAPEDLGSALRQRLRWAQGTLQVLVRDNPLFKKGLSFAQRIQYWTTTFSYFSGFSSLMFLLSPIIYLTTHISPVYAWSSDFLMRLVPYLLLNRLMFLYVSRGVNVWRSEQYSLGLFPVWIRAIISVVIGQRLTFVVTPKQRQSGNYLPLVWPQITIIALTFLAIAYGGYLFAVGSGGPLLGASLNAFWGAYNIAMLLPIVRAAVYRFPKDWQARPPAFLFQRARRGTR